MDVVNVAYIQDLIEAHHYTLGQLEVKSGISKAQWSRILAYKRGVGTKTIAGVMRAFPEARIDQIFCLRAYRMVTKRKEKKIMSDSLYVLTGQALACNRRILQ